MRAARFTPAASARFLAASWRRAGERRLARPELTRQARAWGTLGALAWLIPGAAGIEPFRNLLRAGLGWWALTVLMLRWHLGMFETEAGEPRPLGPADACTLTRAWLVPLAAHRPGPFVCAIGFASDGLDGALARATAPTRAGRDLEGLVDSAFTLAALRGAVRCGWLGRVPATAEAARLLAGAGVISAAYFGSGSRPDPQLARSGRMTAPLRAVGLFAAACGRRRTADACVVLGAVTAIVTGGRRAPASLGIPPRLPRVTRGI